MGTTINQLASVTNQITASVLNSLWEGAAMTLIAWLILRAFKRLNAATRHVIWSALLVSVGALTFIGMVNGLQTHQVAQSAPSPIQRVDSDLSILAASEAGVVKAAEAQPGAAIQRRGAPGKSQSASYSSPIPSGLRVFKVGGSWSVFFIAGWAFVTLFLLGRLVLSFVHLKKLKRTAVPFDEARRGRFQDLLKVAGVRRSIRLCSSGQVTVPVALGLSNPLVLIPEELANQLEESELDQVVLHEAAHLARRDDWSNLVERVLVAVLFFHPAVHWISRRLCLERELACDDWVTSVTGNPKPYALCLTKLAELTELRPSQALASGAWTSKTQLSRRIIMLLNQKLNRTKRVSIVSSVIGVTGLCGLLFVFSQVGQIIAADVPKAPGAGANTGTAANLNAEAESYRKAPEFFSSQAAAYRAALKAYQSTVTTDWAPLELPPTQENVLPGGRASSAYRTVSGGGGGGGGVGLIRDRALGNLLNTQSTRNALTPRTDEERRKAAQLREQVFSSLLETLKNETNSEFRSVAMNSLVRMQPRKMIEPLVEIVLKDKDSRMRGDALSSLAAQPGAASTEALFRLYDQLEEVELKTGILRLLGSRQPGKLSGDDLASSEQWIAKLQQIAKESSSSELKAEAIRQLGRVGTDLQELPEEN